MREVYIIGAARTAIGGFGGSLKDIPAVELGALVIKAALERAGVRPEQVNETIMGCVMAAGQGQNPARQAAMKAGIPREVCAWTLNMVCGSGLKAVMDASHDIAMGEAHMAVAGGMENMSRAPYTMEGSRWGYKMGHQQIGDSIIKDGLTCAIHDVHMGITAENIAVKYGITREEQDQYAERSQARAAAADFSEEIVPVRVKAKKEEVPFLRDEFIRRGTTVEALARLQPVFKKDGTVTAGNASGLNDGAAAVVLCSGEKLKELGLRPLGKLVSFGLAGIDPALMGMGPVDASKKALGIAGWSVEELDLAEINEAFASQSIAVIRELELDLQKTNVNGGAIALGHPIGCSGARILVTLLYGMQKHNAKKGLAALCIGGGMGIAALVERI